MFVRVKSTPNSPRQSVQICESVRKQGRVSQTIVRHVGIAENERQLKELRRLAESIILDIKEERSRNLPLFAPEELAIKLAKINDRPLNVNLKDIREESRVIEGIGEVFGRLYRELGFNKIFDQTVLGRGRTDTLLALVLARLANPSSKLRTAALLEADFGVRLPVGRIYRMMDAIHKRISRVQEVAGGAAMKLFRNKVDVMLYDVTTLYFESKRADDLKGFGFSKDCKMNEVQVVLALVTTKEGLPLAYKLFHGGTFEGGTLAETLQEFSEKFDVERVICVADRGIFSEKNLTWIESKKWEFVVAARLKNLAKSWKDTILDYSDTQDNDAAWIKSWNYSDERRLVVTFSTERRRKDARDRERLLSKIVKQLSADKSISPDKLLRNRGLKKFLTTKEKGLVQLNEEKIEQDQKWDGLYGVMTNSKLPEANVISLYKNLWQIEAAFRLNKHDLKVRPIFHWTKDRIEAHIAICFIAFTLAKHAEYRIALQYKPLSFEHIRNELLAVQASIVRDTKSRKRYRLPSNMTGDARAICRCFGVKRSQVPAEL